MPEPLAQTLRQVQIHIDQAVLVGAVNRYDEEGLLSPARLPPYVIDHLIKAHTLITELLATTNDPEDI